MKMRYGYLCIALLAAAQCIASVAERNAKLDHLTRTGYGVVKLTTTNFDEFVLDSSRNYHIYVLFNAMNPHRNCQPCGPVHDEFEVVAQSYTRQAEKDQSDALPIYFAEADFEENQQIFNSFQIKSVPKIVYFAPTHDTRHSDSEFPNGEDGAVFADEPTADAMVSFVKTMSGYNFEVYRSPLPKLLSAVTFLVVIAFTLRFASERLWNFAMYLLEIKGLWVFASISVFYIAVSGVLYDIIRGVPWIGANPQTRAIEWYTTQSGLQYGMEGAVIGFLNIVCAGAVVVLTVLVPRMSSHRILTTAIIFLMIFAFCYNQIVRLYKLKNPWYGSFF